MNATRIVTERAAGPSASGMRVFSKLTPIVLVLAACDPEDSGPCDAPPLVTGPLQDLFDGATLTGWDGDPTVWRVQAGEIVGASSRDRLGYNTFLVHAATYRDFALEADVKLVGGDANGGIQYRSVVVNPDLWIVAGYQADATSGMWGNIHEELFGRRDLVYAAAACRDAVRDGDWNTYRIEVAGCRVVHYLNGEWCGEFGETAPNRPPAGHVALQYHEPGGFEIRYRNIRIAPAIVAP